MMKKKWICFVGISLVVTMVFAQTGEKKQKEELPTPTHADVAYGPDPMNILDLWLVPSEKPTPLLVFIHGGGCQHACTLPELHSRRVPDSQR